MFGNNTLYIYCFQEDNLEGQSQSEKNQLLREAAGSGNFLNMKTLISAGANPNATDARGGSALHAAALYDSVGAIMILFDAGIVRNAKNLVGNTALHIAADCGNANVVKSLIDGGLDPTETNALGKTALDAAEGKGHTAVVEMLQKITPKQASAGKSGGDQVNTYHTLSNFLVL